VVGLLQVVAADKHQLQQLEVQVAEVEQPEELQVVEV
tara:strand:- start:8 stop:118 length:111 start_codon:yes stop_codon:yes gene_type:complete